MAFTTEELKQAAAGHIERMSVFCGNLIRADAHANLGQIVDELQSPIEAIFALWWCYYADVMQIKEDIQAWPQWGFAPINGRQYRADFVFWPRKLDEVTKDTWFRGVVVELDGHDFHERTPEQVMLRDQRDRDLIAANYVVLHFSGTEMHRHPESVMDQTYSAVVREWNRWRDAVDRKKRSDAMAVKTTDDQQVVS